MSEKMTAQEATRFEHGQSTGSALILTLAAQERGCTCQPYADWFTYRRWKAQGFQVQKGEHGVKLTTYIPKTITNENGEKEQVGTRPWHSTVFCRCQVKSKEVH